MASARPGTWRSSKKRRTSGRSRRRRPILKVTDIGERHAAYLTAIFVGLSLFGLVMVLSASSPESEVFSESPYSLFKRQLMWTGVGAVAFAGAFSIDYRVLRRVASPLMLGCIGLLMLVLVPGVGREVNGSTRWLGFGSFTVQPSELMKLTLIIFVADLLARRERRMDRPELTVRPVMLVLFTAAALIVVQPKLGTPVILTATVLLMLFIAGARMRSTVSWLVAAGIGVVIFTMNSRYAKCRIHGFLDPEQHAELCAFQTLQGRVGVASGGLFGVGLGAGRAKWGFLPEAHTDFIFAIVAEEVGLIGASALIAAFLLLAFFGMRAAMLAPDRFGMLLASGITCWLMVQAFLNIAMVLGVAPVTGEVLPFVSAGGSSLITMMAAAGLLTSIARRAKL